MRPEYIDGGYCIIYLMEYDLFTDYLLLKLDYKVSESKLYKMRQSACLVVNPITVYSYGSTLIARWWIRPQTQ